MALEGETDMTEQLPESQKEALAPVDERIKALIEQISAYIEHYHRGWVELVGIEDQIVTVRLGGACATCGLQTNTLHGWVEGTIRQFFPEIEKVISVE
jgi:Fe-S cluster biogenesis protein NfuA